ncbi:MAG: hypothetical protein V3V78_05120 [Candidatus Woesearchaeota archaeon]
MNILGQTLGFWSALLGGVFILLHVPACNQHWAARIHKLHPLSDFLEKHHDTTLNAALIFALVHITLSLIGLIFKIWI